MYKALTIAGSDSGGGAGIQTDLKTFAALGVYGTSVITALTAQNTCGVRGIHQVPAAFIASQLEAVLSDIPVQAAKTGMLGEAPAIREIVRGLKKYSQDLLVVDPVMVAQSGDSLLAPEAAAVLRDELLPMALLVTPNLPEAGMLLNRNISDTEAMETAARDIRLLGPRHVLIKGGHLPGDEMVDIFYDGKTMHYFSAAKINTSHTHGTGCTYAAAITAFLARGCPPLEAVRQAKRFITTAISYGLNIGHGYGPTDPMGGLLRELAEAKATDSVCRAFLLLQRTPGAGKLLAPGLSNLYFCLEEAKTAGDVASFSGPFIVRGGQIIAVDGPQFGQQSWAADLLLSAHRRNASARSLLLLRFTEETYAAAEAQTLIPAPPGSLALQAFPRLVFSRGGPGREAFLGLLGTSPVELAQAAERLAKQPRSC
ncbi:MAG: Hydroxymethylpyrimidine/phosphomethylpyrimidine kinase [Syntrophomonadaceae bacterium]|nr:Hydroxymethylpyrimidine/phosphomethylpyrimidine kinase [Bacillota bacterium]